MLRRLCCQLLHSGYVRASLPWRTVSVCQYSSQNDADEDASMGKRKGKKRVPILEYEDQKAQEFLDNMNELMKMKMKKLQREIEDWKIEGSYVPNVIRPKEWKLLLTEHDSKNKREKYLTFLAKNEYKRENQVAKRQERAKAKAETVVRGHRVYDEISYPSRSRFRDQAKYNCHSAMVLGKPIVFDLDYPDRNHREETLAVSQLLLSYGNNLRSTSPYHIHFTGYRNHRFQTMIDAEGIDKDLFASFYAGSFMDLFDRDELIYLSPDGPPLKRYEPNKVYVIGGLVDIRRNSDNLSKGKAKQLGIQCGRLPLEKHVSIKDKYLTLNAVMDIMLEVSQCHDWEKALYAGLPATQYRRLTDEQKIRRQERGNPYSCRRPPNVRKGDDRRFKWEWQK